MEITERLNNTIRDVQDFPKPGILFKDITPVLEDPILCRDIVSAFQKYFLYHKVDAIAGIESRGFLFGMPLAIELGVPFITIRKTGKLPYKTRTYKYDLEYGSAEIEVHENSIKPGSNVLVHDDLLATGGTAAATAELILMEKANIVGFSFLVELSFLHGRKRLENYSNNILALTTY